MAGNIPKIADFGLAYRLSENIDAIPISDLINCIKKGDLML